MGQTWFIDCAHAAQNVHSYEQIAASESPASGALQRSHLVPLPKGEAEHSKALAPYRDIDRLMFDDMLDHAMANNLCHLVMLEHERRQPVNFAADQAFSPQTAGRDGGAVGMTVLRPNSRGSG